jgi:hypothetical protein
MPHCQIRNRSKPIIRFHISTQQALKLQSSGEPAVIFMGSRNTCLLSNRASLLTSLLSTTNSSRPQPTSLISNRATTNTLFRRLTGNNSFIAHTHILSYPSRLKKDNPAFCEKITTRLLHLLHYKMHSKSLQPLTSKHICIVKISMVDNPHLRRFSLPSLIIFSCISCLFNID